MAYTLVNFNVASAALDKDLTAAKRDGSYVAKTFDQAVLKEAAALVKASLAVTDDFAKKVTERHKVSKDVIEQMEGLVKKKGKALTESDLKVMETAVRSIKRHHDDILQLGSDVFDALEQFRGGWPDDFLALLDNKAALAPLTSARLKSIDDNKNIDALKRRVEQYVERSKDILKAAQKVAAAAAGAQADPGVSTDEIREFKAAVAEIKNDFEIYVHKATASLEQIANADPKTKPDAGSARMNDSRIANGRGEAKNARGVLKTWTVKIDTFKKVAAKMDDTNKKAAVKALDEAGKQLKTAEGQDKTLSKLEEKAEKVYSALTKLKK